MEIKLAEDGMWGGVIPDVLRNNRISLKIGENLRLDLKDEEFEKLRSLLDQKTQNWFDIAQKIVKENDRKDHLVRDYLQKINDVLNKKENYNEKLQLIVVDFKYDYWINAGKL
jgi:hypothetical protein